MYGITADTKVPDYSKLPLVAEGSDVIVLLTSAKEFQGLKGHYAIFEGKISEVREGSHKVGEQVKALMVQLDDRRRIMPSKDGGTMNYGVNDVISFLETVNCEKFPRDRLNEAVASISANIEGMAVRIVAKKNPGDEKTKPFTERGFLSVPGQDLAKQRALLKSI